MIVNSIKQNAPLYTKIVMRQLNIVPFVKLQMNIHLIKIF